MAALRVYALRRVANPSAVPLTVIALGIALTMVPFSVRAETKVRGTPRAVVVEAQNASVEEILAALTNTFKVQFRSAANLTSGSQEPTKARCSRQCPKFSRTTVSS
jgi:hypothetical protein